MDKPQATTNSGVLDVVELIADEDSDETTDIADIRDAALVRYREFAAIGLLIALFDLTVYRGHGYSGYALGFIAAPILLWSGAPRRGLLGPGLTVFAMLLLLALRMAWLGTEIMLVVGLLLIAAFAMTLSGRAPYILDTLLLGWQSTFAAATRIPIYAKFCQRSSSPKGIRKDLVLKVLMPTVAVAVFSLVFIQANPDLRNSINQLLDSWWEHLDELFGELIPSLPQLILWGIVAWLSVGLLRPLLLPRILGWLGPIVDGNAEADQDQTASPLVPAFRNTLIAVISLFAIYLIFEFQTLWLREFPEGFYYAGYAHEGAAWLTAALALATLVLSAIFRAKTLSDQRLSLLKQLAWIWSGLNILLAIAVYHRLSIYIDFNGMTRMRTVGIVGVTTVLAGFLLVVWKIARNRGFLWLIERQLWALAIGLYILAVMPMDAVIHRYNVNQILAGNLAPAVQITEHDVDLSGLTALTPLLDCQDETIRNGIAARLANEWQRRTQPDDRHPNHWTAFQLAEQNFLSTVEPYEPQLLDAGDPDARESTWEQFRRYAYQWY